MFISLIPRAEADFASMRLILLNVGIVDHTNVVMDIKTEQWTALASCLCYNEVIER